MIHYIYLLSDPRNDKIRYVGKTISCADRYKAHCIVQHGDNHRSHWLNQLHSFGLRPIMEVIEECDESNWAEREIYWIKYYREQGCDLVNATNGGEGFRGHHSEKTKQKMRKAHLPKSHSNTTRIKLMGHKPRSSNYTPKTKLDLEACARAIILKVD